MPAGQCLQNKNEVNKGTMTTRKKERMGVTMKRRRKVKYNEGTVPYVEK